METKQRLIASFEKNSAEVVKVHLQEWHGQTYLDLRVWIAEKAGQEGAECATHKGITLNVELLGDLKKAIDKALAEVELGKPEEPGLRAT
jgi:RecB family endonuclease NucS